MLFEAPALTDLGRLHSEPGRHLGRASLRWAPYNPPML